MSPTKPNKRTPQDEALKQEWLAKNKPTVVAAVDLRGTKPTFVKE